MSEGEAESDASAAASISSGPSRPLTSADKTAMAVDAEGNTAVDWAVDRGVETDGGSEGSLMGRESGDDQDQDASERSSDRLDAEDDESTVSTGEGAQDEQGESVEHGGHGVSNGDASSDIGGMERGFRGQGWDDGGETGSASAAHSDHRAGRRQSRQYSFAASPTLHGADGSSLGGHEGAALGVNALVRENQWLRAQYEKLAAKYEEKKRIMARQHGIILKYRRKFIEFFEDIGDGVPMIDLVMSSDESEAEDLGRLGHSTASAAAPAAQNRVASGRLSVGSERTPSRPVPVPLGLILGRADAAGATPRAHAPNADGHDAAGLRGTKRTSVDGGATERSGDLQSGEKRIRAELSAAAQRQRPAMRADAVPNGEMAGGAKRQERDRDDGSEVLGSGKIETELAHGGHSLRPSLHKFAFPTPGLGTRERSTRRTPTQTGHLSKSPAAHAVSKPLFSKKPLPAHKARGKARIGASGKPKRPHAVWTEEEDTIFIDKYIQIGKKWKEIRDTLEAEHGISRTREQIQTHGQYLIKQGKIPDEQR